MAKLQMRQFAFMQSIYIQSLQSLQSLLFYSQFLMDLGRERGVIFGCWHLERQSWNEGSHGLLYSFILLGMITPRVMEWSLHQSWSHHSRSDRVIPTIYVLAFFWRFKTRWQKIKDNHHIRWQKIKDNHQIVHQTIATCRPAAAGKNYEGVICTCSPSPPLRPRYCNRLPRCPAGHRRSAPGNIRRRWEIIFGQSTQL